MADSNTATVSKIAASASSIGLLVANGLRSPGSVVYNDSTALLYVRLGTAAATTDDWSVKLAQDDYFQLPDAYRGAVQGIWASATGQARVTEVV